MGNIRKKTIKSKYVLVIFNRSTDEVGFVKPTAQELTILANTSDVKYYYDENISMYTFDTNEKFENIKETLGFMLEDLDIHHILIPYDEKQINVFLPKHITKHMFNTYENKEDIYEETMSLQENEEFNSKLKNAQEFFLELEYDEEEDGLLSKITSNNKKTIDEILDKIIEHGINSIDEDEKIILNEFSNK